MYNNNYNNNNRRPNGYGLLQFLAGRRGWDQLSTFLMIISVILELAGSLIRIRYIYWIGLALFFYCIFRTMSRNIPARERENQAYLKVRNRFANWNYFRQMKKAQKRQEKEQRRYAKRAGNVRRSNVTGADFSQNISGGAGASQGSRRGSGAVVYCYFYCPSCRQQVRVPAGKGKIMVTCPKCGTRFETAT